MKIVSGSAANLDTFGLSPPTLDDLVVHVDETGVVWHSRGGQPAISSGMLADEFAHEFPLEPADVVRTMGTPRNAGLIANIYGEQRCNRIRSLRVCSPRASDCRQRRQIPETAIEDVYKWPAHQSSAGGWHEVGSVEYRSYLISASCSALASCDELTALIRQHPLWPALSFVRNIRPDAAARIVGVVLDPRWFVTPDNPDRTSYLIAYLGLLHSVCIQANKGIINPRTELFNLVLSTWQPEPKTQILEANYEALIEDPHLFVMRTSNNNNGIKHKQRQLNKRLFKNDDLISSQRFIKFMRNVWLQAIYPNLELFVPEYFFHRQDEAEAFREHVEIMNAK